MDCQELSKCPTEQGVTANVLDSTHRPESPSEVPVDDSTSTMNVRCSDKLDHKQNNKPATDPDLASVAEAWPGGLPSAIRSAIVAIVRASKGQ
jgi:hypothetical protein